jgi:hypothetical protein
LLLLFLAGAFAGSASALAMAKANFARAMESRSAGLGQTLSESLNNGGVPGSPFLNLLKFEFAEGSEGREVSIVFILPG